MSECQFCHRLDVIKWIHAYEAKLDKKYYPKYERVQHEYTVAIVERSWTKSKGKRNASRSISYRNQGLGFQLNYCPECGRRLK